MLDYHFITTDVFTTNRHGGNQLAVLTDARGLSAEEMLAITREFGYSESVFVLPPEAADHTSRLRIFTPGGELPFAGHPTVGAAITLAEEGIISLDEAGEARIVLEEGVGPVHVRLSRVNERLYAELTAAAPPEHVAGAASRESLASAFSIAPTDLHPRREPAIYSCGVPFTFLPVRDRAVLAKVRLDREAFDSKIVQTAGPNVFVFADDPEDPANDIRARMFAPALGVDEDPATGAACAALTGYLGTDTEDGEHRWTIEQGYEMGRPSLIQITAIVQGGRTVEARVGGHAVRFAEGRIRGQV